MYQATVYNNLAQRVASLPPGRVLDVSYLDTDGKGARVIVTPATDRSGKIGVQGLAIVSNNYASYKRAIDMLGPEYAGYADAYLTQHGTPNIYSSPPTSPIVSTYAPTVLPTYTSAVTIPTSLPTFAIPSIPSPQLTSSVQIPTFTGLVTASGLGSVPSPLVTRNYAPRTLKDTVVGLQPGKFLDVSNIGPDGRGARVILTPNAKSGKFGVEGLPIVSSNYASYALAMQLLGPEYQPYVSAYEQLMNARAGMTEEI